MNENLLFALLHFKMFVMELNSSVNRTCEIFGFAIILMFSIPVTSISQLHYLSRDPHLRIHAVTGAMCTILPASFVLVPICYLHSRCLEMFRSMNSLLAHAVDINRNGSLVYDEHTIILLRKELDCSRDARQRFAAKSFGNYCTYPFLCKVHFWFGLLLLMIMSGNQLGRNGNLLLDKFISL